MKNTELFTLNSRHVTDRGPQTEYFNFGIQQIALKNLKQIRSGSISLDISFLY